MFQNFIILHLRYLFEFFLKNFFYWKTNSNFSFERNIESEKRIVSLQN